MSSEKVKQMAKDHFNAHDDVFEAKAAEILDDVLKGRVFNVVLHDQFETHIRFDCCVDWWEHTDYAADRLPLIVSRLIAHKIDIPVCGRALGIQDSIICELTAIRHIACKSLARVIAPYLVYEELANAKESREQSRGGVL